MRHFDMQLVGGMVLNDGKIAEMRTGEGKTLVATLPSYLNALTGKGCPCSDGERLPRQARLRLDGSPASVPGIDRWLQPRKCRTTRSRPHSPLTSPTAPTTNSVLTICATTWCRTSPERVMRGLTARHRGRGGLNPDRRGAHATHYLRQAEDSTALYTKINTLIPLLKPQADENRRGLLG